MTEGEEELLVFNSVLLFGPDDDEGPRIASLPRPEFEGSSKGRGEEYELPAGRYAFMQARPADEAELLSFLEAFARDAWWEGIKLEGPFFLRRLREDGRTAVQYLRRCSD